MNPKTKREHAQEIFTQLISRGVRIPDPPKKTDDTERAKQRKEDYQRERKAFRREIRLMAKTAILAAEIYDQEDTKWGKSD
jgi:hypothetical protein